MCALKSAITADCILVLAPEIKTLFGRNQFAVKVIILGIGLFVAALFGSGGVGWHNWLGAVPRFAGFPWPRPV